MPVELISDLPSLVFSKDLAPTNKLESWKYTDFKKLYARDLKLSKLTSKSKLQAASFSEGYLFSRDLTGTFTNELPIGVTLYDQNNCPKELLDLVGTLKTEDDRYHTDLNLEHHKELVVVHISAGTIVVDPIIISFEDEIENSAARFTRVLIVAEVSSEATVLELAQSCGSELFINSVCEVICREGSILRHVKVQRELDTSIVFSSLQTEIAAKANFSSFIFNLGGKQVRNEVYPTFLGENSEAHLYGLSICNGNQEIDNSTVIDHAQPNCFSRELYKGIYNGSSKGAFSGTIIVRPDAQKTNAIQSNQSILLSDKASISTRPQLKIWADDVKCTHGATIGAIDEAALFYIRTRGVPEAEARALLLAAFAGEVLLELRPLNLRIWIESLFLSECHIRG